MGSGHGGNLRELAHAAGKPACQILDFSASINPLGAPECLRRVISRNLENVAHYPDEDSRELVSAIGRRYGLPGDRIIVGNGSSEILHALVRAMKPARAVIPMPAYSDYAASAGAADVPVRAMPIAEERDFVLDLQCIAAELHAGDMLFLGQPNNPTGLMIDSEALAAMASSRHDVTFVIDEAFADFVAGYESIALRQLPNVIVLHSLTKFYAIPGLRLGFAVAEAEIAKKVRRQIPPWSVNTLAQAAGAAVLGDHDYASRTVEFVASRRRELAEELQKLPGICIYPGVANFLLARLNRADINAPELSQRLLKDGIAIRTFAKCDHDLDDRFFRVAVRTEEENGRLCDALARALGGNRSVATKRSTPAIMFQGTSSNAGKSILTAALCRIMFQDGVRVAPFKSQNMSLNSFVTRDGCEMGRAQVVQAQACRLEPDVRMNPILLKPNSDTGSQVIVRGKPVGNMRVAEYVNYKPLAFAAAKECYDSLAREFDAIVIEGAGSPGEVNLKSHDIVNMRMAEYAQAPVLIVGDIDRGGVFASFVGTMEVLADWERKLVAGWIVNRFRGDVSLLGPALDYTLSHTGRPVFGVVPYLHSLEIPQEDSVEFKSGALDRNGDGDGRDAVDLAVIDLPHISNFTDFDALAIERDVKVRIVRRGDDLGRPDAVIIPGSKNTLADLAYLQKSGLADRIVKLAKEGRAEIVGICGGLQMLGRVIEDPHGIESAQGRLAGLNLLDVSTVLEEQKTLIRATARHAPSGLSVSGYEIHHGQTAGAERPAFVRADGQSVGVASADHRVWGTYLHGVFDADEFRRWFIDRLRARRGLTPLGGAAAHYSIEPALDRLADVVRRSLRMDEIYRLVGLR